MGKKIASTLIILMTIISCTFMLSYNDFDTLKKFSSGASGVFYMYLNNMTLKVNEQMSKLSTHDKSQNNVKDVDKQVPVFNTEYRILNNQLSTEDKEGILSVARRLSPADYERINEYLSSDVDQQIIKAVKLLQDRLTSKEYQAVETIMGGYINEEKLRVELERK